MSPCLGQQGGSRRGGYDRALTPRLAAKRRKQDCGPRPPSSPSAPPGWSLAPPRLSWSRGREDLPRGTPNLRGEGAGWAESSRKGRAWGRGSEGHPGRDCSAAYLTQSVASPGVRRTAQDAPPRPPSPLLLFLAPFPTALDSVLTGCLPSVPKGEQNREDAATGDKLEDPRPGRAS